MVGSWLLDLTASALAGVADARGVRGPRLRLGRGPLDVDRRDRRGRAHPGADDRALLALLVPRADDFANRLLSAMRKQFGGHEEKTRLMTLEVEVFRTGRRPPTRRRDRRRSRGRQPSPSAVASRSPPRAAERRGDVRQPRTGACRGRRSRSSRSTSASRPTATTTGTSPISCAASRPAAPPTFARCQSTAHDLEAAAAVYADALPESLDLVHLGLGPDGHTASLVPGDPVLDVADRDVAVTGVYQDRTADDAHVPGARSRAADPLARHGRGQGRRAAAAPRRRPLDPGCPRLDRRTHSSSPTPLRQDPAS